MHIYVVLLEKFVFPLIEKILIRDDFLAMLRRLEGQGQFTPETYFHRLLAYYAFCRGNWTRLTLTPCLRCGEV